MAGIKDVIAEDISKTPIPNMLKLLYGMGDAMDLLRLEVDRMIRDVYREHGIQTRHGFAEMDLKGLTEYCKAAKSMSYWFDRAIEPKIQVSTLDEDGNGECYDNFHSDSNMLLRWVMYGVDRMIYHPELLDTVKGLSKGEQRAFPDELIERFNQR